MSTLHLNSRNFNTEVLESKTPVLVDFYADWCGPCHLISPMIEDLAVKYEGKIKVCKVNVDFSNDVAGKYSIQSIPTVLLFKDGKQVDGFMGALPQDRLESFIKKHIS